MLDFACDLTTELSGRARRPFAMTQRATIFHGPLQRFVRWQFAHFSETPMTANAATTITHASGDSAEIHSHAEVLLGGDCTAPIGTSALAQTGQTVDSSARNVDPRRPEKTVPHLVHSDDRSNCHLTTALSGRTRCRFAPERGATLVHGPLQREVRALAHELGAHGCILHKLSPTVLRRSSRHWGWLCPMAHSASTADA